MTEGKRDYETLIRQFLRPDQLGSGFWGDLIGAGWWPLLKGFLQRASTVDGFCLEQVKEKFGGLRLYWHVDGEDHAGLEALSGATMTLASRTCELCGSETRVGQTRGGGWVKTICFACFAAGAMPDAKSLCVAVNLRRDGTLEVE